MSPDPTNDDATIPLVALAVGVAIVAATVLRHAPWGAAATLGFIVSVLASRLLLASAILRWSARRKRRAP